jgi:ATP-dependent Clp protease ATP-binding subunit ClpA
MFERFTEGARQVVVEAQVEARALQHGWVGTEHLLLAFLRGGSSVAPVLTPLGLTYEGVRQEVAALTSAGSTQADSALRDLGIDIGEVRRRVEASFGPGALDAPQGHERWRGRVRLPRRRRRGGGHIPFTSEAKKSLELALREALRLGDREITVEHIVLATMRTEGLGARAVTALGVAPRDVRRAVLAERGRAA